MASQFFRRARKPTSLLYDLSLPSKSVSISPLKPTFSTPSFSLLNPKPSLPVPPLLSLFSTLSKPSKPSLPVPFRAVSLLDCQALSIIDYENSCKKISYCFPLIDFVGGSSMRRTLFKNEFTPDRNFVFINVAFGDVANFDLLVSIESGDFVGVRGSGRVVVFDESVADLKDFSVMAGVSRDLVFIVDIRPNEGANYLLPIEKDFKSSIASIKKFIDNHQEYLVSYEKKHYMEHCLGFMSVICLRGVFYRWTRGLVVDSLALKSSAKKAIDVLLTKRDWEEMSTAWFSGHRKWTSKCDLIYDIEEEIAVVKAPHVEVEPPEKFNPTAQSGKKQRRRNLLLGIEFAGTVIRGGWLC